MSVISGRTVMSSILKSPAGAGRRTSMLEQPMNRVRFKIPHAQQIRNVIIQFISRENVQRYEELVCLIRDCVILDDDLLAILTECRECISLLGKDVRLFIEAILSISWLNKTPSVISNYQTFILELLTAHNYHVSITMDMLVRHFVCGEDWIDCAPTEETIKTLTNVHYIIEKILQIIPMSCELLYQSIECCYPYYKKPANEHVSYIHNLLWILTYRPSLRQDVLMLIVNKLIILDVNAPRLDIEDMENYSSDEESMFKMETDDSRMALDNRSLEMKHPIANTLDKCMFKIMEYMRNECYVNNELVYKNMEKLYKDLIVVFEKIVLPTHAIHHVQFLFFYLCSFKVVLVDAFLSVLWRKVCNPNVPTVIRQVAVCYIASVLARSSFIPLAMLRAMLLELSNWLHTYISSAHIVNNVHNAKGGASAHGVFYSVAQALFYVIAFRHKDLTDTRKGLVFLQSLNLTKLVTCPLNPLRYCLFVVVQNFAAVTRAEQLAYCYTVMERNERNNMVMLYGDQNQVVRANDSLGTFFPFDPYLLKRSAEYIAPIYLQYQSPLSAPVESPSSNDFQANHEEDVFLSDNTVCDSTDTVLPSHRNNKIDFSYGTSPGFK